MVLVVVGIAGVLVMAYLSRTRGDYYTQVGSLLYSRGSTKGVYRGGGLVMAYMPRTRGDYYTHLYCIFTL